MGIWAQIAVLNFLNIDGTSQRTLQCFAYVHPLIAEPCTMYSEYILLNIGLTSKITVHCSAMYIPLTTVHSIEPPKLYLTATGPKEIVRYRPAPAFYRYVQIDLKIKFSLEFKIFHFVYSIKIISKLSTSSWPAVITRAAF